MERFGDADQSQKPMKQMSRSSPHRAELAEPLLHGARRQFIS